jgi:glyoxalase family protein
MNEKNKITGIHHITAIAGNPQKNVDFYIDVLGLKLVKKTVNFDDPHTYHLYYGDATGNPGTILTFFPWNEEGFKGKRGTGQIAAISFSIPVSSLEFWKTRLTKKNISFGLLSRFNEEVLILEDYDGFELEIVASEEETRPGWKPGNVPEEHSIRGFWGATIWHKYVEMTNSFITNLLEFKKLKETENRIRFTLDKGGPGTYMDILQLPDKVRGIMGVGAVHHIAFRTDNDETQLGLREKLISKNVQVTPIIDRNYFHSIYFREPGNVLFEIATDPPGFLIDEKLEALGTLLKLPKWFEPTRAEIEAKLPKIKAPNN